jgi:hypothetical protein
MANTKISALSALTGANLAVGDLFPLVDVSDTTQGAGGSTKNMTAAEVVIGLRTNGLVQGPASAVDNALVRYDATTGKLVQDSLITLSDAGNLAGTQNKLGFGATDLYISSYLACANIFGMGDASSINVIFEFASQNVIVMNSGARLAWGSQAVNGGTGAALRGSLDLAIVRDAANTLGLRNGAVAQIANIYGSYTSATDYQRLAIKTIRESTGTLSGATYTSTATIPAHAVLIGVTTNVTTVITGATSYSVGDGTDVDLWGATIGVADGSQSRTADFTAIGATGAATAARNVVLTANGSNFSGGIVEICLHYLMTEAEAS